MALTYSGELEKYSRSKIQVIEITGDFCANTFGVSPCTATGTECYNTFYTCKDTPNFDKTTKTYMFSLNNKPMVTGAYPTVIDVSDVPSEIKEKNTVVKRLKIRMYDHPDDDIGIDPYVAERTSVQGTFWKKFIARNPNYKGRLITLKEGFPGLTYGSYQTKFAGRLENIKIDKNIVEIEAVDLMKALSELDYPIITTSNITATIGKYWGEVANLANMQSLDAEIGDYCKRKDLTAITNFTVTTAYDASGTHTTAQYYYIVAYDAELRPVARSDEQGALLGMGDNAFDLAWDAVTGFGAVQYRIFRYDSANSNYEYYINYTTSYTDINDTVVESGVGVPNNAEKYYEKTDGSPDGWTWMTDNEFDVTVNSSSDFESDGYFQVDEEIFEYNSKTSTTFSLRLSNRALFGTAPDRHEVGSNVKALFVKESTNPFTMLKTFLTSAGIGSSYISSKFDTYIASWAGPNVKLELIKKEVKLSELYFQLVNDLNCISWVDEDGKVTIVKQDEEPGSFDTITDDDIIKDSLRVDFNEESRQTRWILFHGRFDVDKSLTDREAYSNVNVTVSVESEASTGYNDKIEDVQYSPFLYASLSGTASYISDLLDARETRTKQAAPEISFDLEMRSEGIKTGDIIKLSTRYLQDENGDSWNEVKCRVIKKDKKLNKISYVVKRYY